MIYPDEFFGLFFGIGIFVGLISLVVVPIAAHRKGRRWWLGLSMGCSWAS